MTYAEPILDQVAKMKDLHGILLLTFANKDPKVMDIPIEFGMMERVGVVAMKR